MARYQHDEHTVGDGMQFEAIRIGDHKHQADDDPYQRRRKSLTEALAEHGQDHGAEEYQEYDLVCERAEFAGRKRPNRSGAAAHENDQDRDHYGAQKQY